MIEFKPGKTHALDIVKKELAMDENNSDGLTITN
jgi:hypothetical protein